MIKLGIKEKTELFAKYIGNKIWIEDIYPDRSFQHQFGKLIGVQPGSLLVQLNSGEKLWFNLIEDCPSYRIRLLLKPLSALTQKDIDTANNLPATAFISTFYIKSGFDMPIFIKPNHPLNSNYLKEIDIADYRNPEEIVKQQFINMQVT